jgi:hypothetical protein
MQERSGVKLRSFVKLVKGDRQHGGGRRKRKTITLTDMKKEYVTGAGAAIIIIVAVVAIFLFSAKTTAPAKFDPLNATYRVNGTTVTLEDSDTLP